MRQAAEVGGLERDPALLGGGRGGLLGRRSLRGFSFRRLGRYGRGRRFRRRRSRGRRGRLFGLGGLFCRLVGRLDLALDFLGAGLVGGKDFPFRVGPGLAGGLGAGALRGGGLCGRRRSRRAGTRGGLRHGGADALHVGVVKARQRGGRFNALHLCKPKDVSGSHFEGSGQFEDSHGKLPCCKIKTRCPATRRTPCRPAPPPATPRPRPSRRRRHSKVPARTPPRSRSIRRGRRLRARPRPRA